ncbi:MAG: hypothetical protein ACFFEE_05450 [Candidatus Thorarchaeota archaeon]
MSSERNRSDEYWMGVRDALRMVDSFNKWARRNRERAKDLDDFIHDGLIAAAKRCESCLKEDLGLTFTEGENSLIDDQVPSGYETAPYTSLELESEEVPIEQTDDDITIESVGRSDTEEMEDISLDGPQREFTSDFELVEPSSLEVESSAPDTEEGVSEEVIPHEEEDVKEKKPSFTWADYEQAVTPTKEEPAVDEEDLEEALELVSELQDEVASKEETPRKVLIPSEEPALPTDEFESSIFDDTPPPLESDELEETESSEHITEPPPPPPPPESEEDEEERRRRARRLFFGD